MNTLEELRKTLFDEAKASSLASYSNENSSLEIS